MKKRLVILGAGFAGLQLARRMSKNKNFDITLIDRYNFHQFQPLFYQVATARLEPSAISFPLRKIFQKSKNIHIRIGPITNVDTNNQIVYSDEIAYTYDYLVIATGCSTNYFGNTNFEKYAYPMKSTIEAIELRNRILQNFEDALNASKEELPGIMNIVVAGGGPTGVELAGAMAEMKKYILPKDYPDMNFSSMSIILVEGAPNTLQAMSNGSRNMSKKYLEELGVQVWTNAIAEDYNGYQLILKDGRVIETQTLIWGAGIKGNIPNGIPIDLITKGNRLKVDSTNRLIGQKNVYAIGDIAYMENDNFPTGHPQVANVAISQAKNLANNLSLSLKDKPFTPFIYKSPGSMATVGKHKAVVDLPNFSFQGRIAWYTWMFLHLMLILSVRNKFFIFINWMISYFTNDTTLRLILRPNENNISKTKKNIIVGT